MKNVLLSLEKFIHCSSNKDEIIRMQKMVIELFKQQLNLIHQQEHGKQTGGIDNLTQFISLN